MRFAFTYLLALLPLLVLAAPSAIDARGCSCHSIGNGEYLCGGTTCPRSLTPTPTTKTSAPVIDARAAVADPAPIIGTPILSARVPSCSCHEIGNTGEYICGGTTCGRDLSSAEVDAVVDTRAPVPGTPVLSARVPSCSCHEIGDTGEYLCGGTTCGRDISSAVSSESEGEVKVRAPVAEPGTGTTSARAPSCSCHKIGDEYICGGTTCGRDLSSAEIVARDFEVVSKRCKNDIGQTVPCTKAVEIEKRCKNDAGQTVPCTKKRTAEIEKRCKNDAGQTVPCTK